MPSTNILKLLPLVLALALSAAGHAQESSPLTREELMQALAERDALIIDLLNRVQALESAVRETSVAGVQSSRQEAYSPELAVTRLDTERALEQSLIQQGARLLAPGQFQLALGAAQVYRENRIPQTAVANGSTGIGLVRSRNEISALTAQARLGLPLGMQLNMSLPWVKSSSRQTLLGSGQPETTVSGSGAGDLRIGLAKTLWQERTWIPQTQATLVWITGSGKTEDESVFLGAGFTGYELGLDATWQRDPVVFLAGVDVQQLNGKDGLEPGDAYSFTLGAGLAISADTSVTAAFNQRLTDEVRIQGNSIPGTDQHSTQFTLSASTLLGNGSLLQVNAGFGLTPDAPDYQLGFSLPMRSRGLW